MRSASVPPVISQGKLIGHERTLDRRLGLFLPGGLLAVVWAGWMIDGLWGSSYPSVQGIGIASVALVAGGIAWEILLDPSALARPVVVFLVGSLYFFLFDAAVMREVDEFQPRIVLITFSLCDLFVAISLLAWYAIRPKNSPFVRLLRRGDMTLSGRAFFWAAVSLLALELGKRLVLAHGNVSLVIWEMLQARALGDEGGTTTRGVEGDWRVILLPIDIGFLAIPYLADRAVLRGVATLQKVALLLVAGLQLTIQALSGTRGALVMSLALPIFARAAEHRSNRKRMVWGLVLGSFVLAPLMDTMVKVRAYGWSEVDSVDKVSWNMAEAHRDDNLFWVANLVDLLERNGGVVAHHEGLWGVFEGLRTAAWFWGISLVPRAIWPNKPSPSEMEDDSRPSFASSSAVGDLVRSGGLSFLLLGACVFGLVIRWLEPVYWMEKGDGALLEYAFLLLVVLTEIRAVDAFQFMPLAFVALWSGCAFLGRRQNRDRSRVLPHRAVRSLS